MTPGYTNVYQFLVRLVAGEGSFVVPWVRSPWATSTGASVFSNVVSDGWPSPRSSHGNMEHVMVCDGWLEADAVTPSAKFLITSL
ncbi:hypothetical protein PoB_005752500 [Plakobranchus ocellatus]|uniref:Uncharacterized protein n=1 Tax=Plakobranchus ocellatus TaxID=259542 RepID=A0AAV4CHK3_9GAST|nr:hypothetical protein PoB_005752500 [Plakobranchus ocellatus]